MLHAAEAPTPIPSPEHHQPPVGSVRTESWSPQGPFPARIPVKTVLLKLGRCVSTPDMRLRADGIGSAICTPRIFEVLQTYRAAFLKFVRGARRSHARPPELRQITRARPSGIVGQKLFDRLVTVDGKSDSFAASFAWNRASWPRSRTVPASPRASPCFCGISL